jgi:mono/diheme cytochrome c family protein
VTRKLLLAVALVGLGGCNWWYNDVPSPDDLMHHISWFDHMIKSKAIQPYQGADVPRNTPAGAVPVGGGEADWGTGNPAKLVFNFDTMYAKKLAHPHVTPRPDSRSGEAVFNTYCAVCHGAGATGSADAAVKEMLAPSLLTAQARGYTDGYLYSMLRYGRGRMPQYGDKIVRQDERWAVVDYLRSLQAAAPVAPSAFTPTPAPAPAKKGAH